MTINRIKRVGTLLCLSAIAVLPVHAEEGQWRLSSGLDTSTGDYGDTQDTEIAYVPFSAAYYSGNWKSKATIGILEITGPGNVVGGGDSAVVIGKQGSGRRRTESGVGDLWLAETYSLPTSPLPDLFVDLSAKLKLPLADEDRGLGTGEVDYVLQADLFQAMGQITPMLTLAYKIKGDPPGAKLDDVWFVSVGADWRVRDGLNVGATLDVQQASTAASEDARELFAYVSSRLDRQWSATGYGYLGLSDGSPDLGLGVQLTYRL